MKYAKPISLIALTLSIYIGVQTRSDALLIAWGVGLISFIVLSMVRHFHSPSPWRILLAVSPIAAIIGFLFIFVNAEVLYADLLRASEYMYYGEGNQGSVRVGLWSNAIHALMVSPVYGLGPGAFAGIHAPFDGMEAHNTMLDWGVQTGIIGILLLLSVVALAAKRLWKKGRMDLLAGLISLSIFAQFHYVLRQPVVWALLLWFLIADDVSKNTTNKVDLRSGSVEGGH